MVSLSQRMRKLQTKLLAIRLGPGALVLPKDVKRIHMRFAKKINGGAMGPRQFWKNELIRLKYHNPAVSMTIDREIDNADPATMSIHFATENASQTSDGTTAASDQPERVETINMKNYTNSEILDALVKLTKAYPVEATPEEQEELAKLEEQRRWSEKDSKLSQEVRARVRREKELLEQARGDLASQPA